MANNDRHTGWSKTTLACVMLLLAAAAAVWMWGSSEARSFLVPLLVLACPLMHLFMHRGHRHGQSGGHDVGNRHDHREPNAPRPGA